MSGKDAMDQVPGLILHICTPAEWQSVDDAGWYRCASLESEGFIHCSAPAQVVEVADSVFRGRSGLILLVIDPARVIPDIRVEEAGNGQSYPHIYGALNSSAVVGTLPFEPDAEGRFTLPGELAPLVRR